MLSAHVDVIVPERARTKISQVFKCELSRSKRLHYAAHGAGFPICLPAVLRSARRERAFVELSLPCVNKHDEMQERIFASLHAKFTSNAVRNFELWTQRP